ncbi:FAM43A [Cordylochernes scorpioides]|uniref:FAM43A n=1 Tax=Cordylochernes scorpioides TaxID=51811 RepID=A0ABY6KW65_9ARAC|nr:FAM43A [Cordylochernes scorpioides]
MRISKFWNKRSLTISEYDPSYRVIYLGNVLTPYARTAEKALETLWKNYLLHNKNHLLMKLTVASSGLKALTKEHGLTEYWANRITFCQSPVKYPRVFCWVYRHEGKRLKQELRCHAVLCPSVDKAVLMVDQLNQRLSAALQEFRREKMARQKCRLSISGTIPLRKVMLSTGASNFRPPLERTRSAPKLTCIEEDEEEEAEEETDLGSSCQGSDVVQDDLDSLSEKADSELWSVDETPNPFSKPSEESSDTLSDESGYSEDTIFSRIPSKAEDKPVRLGSKAQPSAEITAKDVLQINSSMNSKENENYVNPPAGSQDANSAAPIDLAAIPTANAAAQVRRNWADITEEGRKRRRGSANSPTAAAPSSNAGGSRTIRRPQSSAGSVPRAQEIRATRAHIADARARQASSSEEHCVYIEHSPELEPFHYLRALDRKLRGTAGVIQITKVNGHQLLGLTNRGLAERLISEGLEVEGTLLRAFPFRKRAERITVGNLPFFVADSAVITALSPFGRVTSIAPKQMKAGPYVYVDGRRDVFITLHEGITIERLPTRLDINIKGQAWPAYLSSGIRCSRCHGQGHRRAICPLLAGLANNTRMAPPTTPAGVPPPTTSAPPQRSAAQPPAPTPSNPAMEVCSAPPVARAVLHSSAPRPSPPAAPAFPMEETPPAPPPVTPAPSLRTPGSREPAAPTPDVEMSIVEETLASFTSSAKNATRVDLDAFIEGHPSVSFTKTDALGLGREEVLDLLSSRTKAQRKGPLLSPPQCDALVGLIGQILDLRPGAASNLYKVLGQVKAELRTTSAVPPTPTLPAPWPSKPTPPALHGEKTSPDITTPPPPLSTEFIDACYDQANDIIYELSDERYSEPLSDIGVTEGDIVEAIIFPDDREPLLRRLSTQKRTTLAGIVSAASERARSSDPFVREGLRILSEMLPPPICKSY